MLECLLTSRTWMGGSESHSHRSADWLQVSKMLPGSWRTRILPVGQVCAHDESLGAGEQRLVAGMQTGLAAFLHPPLQGGSPTQYLLKQGVPSPHLPAGSHFSNLQPRPLAKTPISLHTSPCAGQEPSCVQGVYLSKQ